jgi:hypothetical protein
MELPASLSDLFRPATDKEIRSWSFGQVAVVVASASLSWQSLRGTLFDQAVLGPLKDHVCACGRYQSSKFRGMICEICGVKVATSAVRRERFGHISLPTQIAHPLASSDATLSVMPVLPAAFRESLGGRTLDDGYAEVMTASEATAVGTAVKTFFQSILPIASVASQWNLAELGTFARGLALTSKEGELGER